MKNALAILLILIALIVVPAGALEYEDKPNLAISSITVFKKTIQQTLPTDRVERGENLVSISVYNNAQMKNLKYENEQEAMFFSDESAIFTAYKIKIELIGDEDIEVLTPAFEIPAMKPMQRETLTFIVKVKENAKSGEHELKLKSTFYRIDSVDMTPFGEMLVPKSFSITESYLVTQIANKTISNTTSYEYKLKLQEYEITFIEVENEIPVKLRVEDRVKLEVVEVTQSEILSLGKGEIRMKIRNAGDYNAEKAYLVLKMPAGFEVSGKIEQSTSTIPMQMYAMYGLTSTISQSSTSSSETTVYIGDLPAGGYAETTVRFKVKTGEAGNYTLRVKLYYLDEFGNVKESNEVPIGVKVGEKPKIKIEGIESGVYVNSAGKVVLKFTSSTNLKDVSVKLSTSDPLSVLSSENYIGDLEAGKSYTAVFTVKASSWAEAVVYPAEVVLKFKSVDEYFELDPLKVGIAVNPKIELLVEDVAEINAGDEKIVTFTIKNAGNLTLRDATARITIVDPFSSTDDSAYIGDLAPGASVEAKFKLSVDREATPKLYALNLEVKYKDAQGNWAYSEPVKALINVKPAQFPYHLLALIGIAVIVVIVVYMKRRK
ncbi:MAG: S-layer protein [Archaeoglobales archaeon]|nr:S-layer protein [Archaeoglobales archaeon]